ncbi:MAG: hypothetical protein ACFFCE_07965 [Promethearchaeota archaeon]
MKKAEMMGLNYEQMNFIDDIVSKIKNFTEGNPKVRETILEIIITALNDLKKNVNIHK